MAGLKTLQWWHRDLAKDLAWPKHIDTLMKKWGHYPWNKSKRTIQRLMNDPLVKEEAERIKALSDTAMANGRAKAQLMVEELAIPVVERELMKVPIDPRTGEGDENCDPAAQTKLAMDFLKAMDIGKVANAREAKITIVFEDDGTVDVDVKTKAKEFEEEEIEFNNLDDKEEPDA